MTNRTVPPDYRERVYAGWLGKCIGVRFGAPIETWTYEEIRDHLGELTGYFSEDRDKIFKPDDDTTVPMIQIRAFDDYGISPDLTAEQIANTLLSYVGYEHGSLWWGGYGISTEHTAYLNLVNGIPAPRSGSIEQNGAALAEQIGGQIFSDIWGLVAPNQPDLAATLAERASSMSHGGNAIYGGRFIAAMVSTAFGESDPKTLIKMSLQQIPSDSEYARVINAMWEFYHKHPEDWHKGFAYLKANFGYDRYPGIVHIIPNAGVIALGLLYGEGDFSRTLQITNMAGWDTDCNVGNVGAIMGVALGLDAIGASWREPMNDLLITASLIGTRNILTIPQCADLFFRIGQTLSGVSVDESQPRYHFFYRGSTNNFKGWGQRGRPIHLYQTTIDDQPVLGAAIRKLNKKGESRISTRTYYETSELSANYYGASFSPLIYPGQSISARLYLPESAPDTIRAGLYVYDGNGQESHQDTSEALQPGTWTTLRYTIPPLTDVCFSEVGIVLRNGGGTTWDVGSVYLSELDWSGAPNYKTTFAHARPQTGAISQWTYWRGYWRIDDGAYCGSGPLENETYSGDINWTDYTLSAQVSPVLGDYHLINARVKGAMRSYAFGLTPDQTVTLYKKDHQYHVIQATDFAWQHHKTYQLSLRVEGNTLIATVKDSDRSATIEARDNESPYLNGQIGLSTWYGSHTRYHSIEISGIESS